MSLVCLMIGLRVPLSHPHLTMTLKALPRAFGGGGGGGGGPSPKTIPIHIFFFQEGTPWVLHLHLRQFAFIPRAKFLCRVRMPIAV